MNRFSSLLILRLFLMAGLTFGAGCARLPIDAQRPGAVPAEEAGAGEPDRRLGGASWSGWLLYPVNRVFDLCDVARFGINVGPGYGVDAQATDLARAAFIRDTSVGLGFQGLRRLPFCARRQSDMAVGPVRTPPLSGFDWQGGFWDVGLEGHALIAGGHLYINPHEILDFVGGWFLWDPAEDDWETAF